MLYLLLYITYPQLDLKHYNMTYLYELYLYQMLKKTNTK